MRRGFGSSEYAREGAGAHMRKVYTGQVRGGGGGTVGMHGGDARRRVYTGTGAKGVRGLWVCTGEGRCTGGGIHGRGIHGRGRLRTEQLRTGDRCTGRCAPRSQDWCAQKAGSAVPGVNSSALGRPGQSGPGSLLRAQHTCSHCHV